APHDGAAFDPNVDLRLAITLKISDQLCSYIGHLVVADAGRPQAVARHEIRRKLNLHVSFAIQVLVLEQDATKQPSRAQLLTRDFVHARPRDAEHVPNRNGRGKLLGHAVRTGILGEDTLIAGVQPFHLLTIERSQNGAAERATQWRVDLILEGAPCSV